MAFASLAGLDLDDRIPPVWAKEFGDLIGEDPPAKFNDSPTRDSQSTMEETRRVLEQLSQLANLQESPRE